MSEPILQISNLSVDLPRNGDRSHAVEKVSFSVNAGEIVCVVGESGSGKSVTAHSVMGLLPKGQLTPTGGEILLEGENVLNASPGRLRALRGTRMSMIFQEPMTALNPVLTCGEQIDEVLQIHTDLALAVRKEKVLAIMEAVHLPDPARIYGAYPHQLSGGQRQRVMIAQALVLDPVLLIADEPTTALDVTTQAQILRLISEMQERRGTGVLFITHDFGVVADIADRVVVMEKGQVVEMGTTEAVLKRPQHSYTRMLIDAVPTLDPPSREENAAPIMLETAKLSKIYGTGGFFRKTGEVRAASEVDLKVRGGETLGIVGESGSGKSTVARCIARLVDPTSGSIRVGDLDVATMSERELRPHRRRCQIVFQDPYRSLNPRRSVGASIIEGPVNFGTPHKEAYAMARELMSLVGLSPDALDRYPHQFSGGQRQRICIARALAMRPEILIADEAVSALDVSVQTQVLELLEDVRRKFNLALLFITHDLRVAAQICDRIMVMKSGLVVEQGRTAELFAAPQHPYTKALFEAAPGRTFEFARTPSM
ncbi:ABC transporter ATP-binding protein [Chelativorans alearense]|uniref:ABC transporter ATP-binding protein n=1 Tax=Chelativorans alearense TaxID=2681495 RepID=UPI0013D3D9BE|nr:ABC transporter ATP-binding protein [Chelativorans alearense]